MGLARGRAFDVRAVDPFFHAFSSAFRLAAAGRRETLSL
jgi:hypothetical protein